MLFLFFYLTERKFEVHLVLTQQMDLFPDPLNVFQVSEFVEGLWKRAAYLRI